MKSILRSFNYRPKLVTRVTIVHEHPGENNTIRFTALSDDRVVKVTDVTLSSDTPVNIPVGRLVDYVWFEPHTHYGSYHVKVHMLGRVIEKAGHGTLGFSV